VNEEDAVRTAGFASRFVAMTVDVLIIVAVEAMAVGFIVAVRSVFPSFVPRFLLNHRVAVGAVVSALFVVAYFVAFWTLSGRTPGKGLMGLRVIAANGDRFRAGRAILRFFGYIVLTIPIYLGFLWVLVDSHRLGWHDHLASTWVVYVASRRSVRTREPETTTTGPKT